MPVNAVRFPKVNARAGQTFADWLLSPEGQAEIGEVGKAQYGRSLFVPAASKREEDLLVN
jgi:tungstate transport system substrate-binding protein